MAMFAGIAIPSGGCVPSRSFCNLVAVDQATLPIVYTIVVSFISKSHGELVSFVRDRRNKTGQQDMSPIQESSAHGVMRTADGNKTFTTTLSFGASPSNHLFCSSSPLSYSWGLCDVMLLLQSNYKPALDYHNCASAKKHHELIKTILHNVPPFCHRAVRTCCQFFTLRWTKIFGLY